jgi:hypothetical protein
MPQSMARRTERRKGRCSGTNEGVPDGGRPLNVVGAVCPFAPLRDSHLGASGAPRPKRRPWNGAPGNDKDGGHRIGRTDFIVREKDLCRSMSALEWSRAIERKLGAYDVLESAGEE